jgi:hypothetical protein
MKLWGANHIQPIAFTTQWPSASNWSAARTPNSRTGKCPPKRPVDFHSTK